MKNEKENKIIKHLNELYVLLEKSDNPMAEEHLGYISEIKAYWEGDDGSFSEVKE